MAGEATNKRQRTAGNAGGSGSSRTGAGTGGRGDGSGSGSEAVAVLESGGSAEQEELVSDAAPADLAVITSNAERRYLVNRGVLALSSETFRTMLQDCELPMSPSGDYAELRILDEAAGPSLHLFLRLMYPRSLAFMGDEQALMAMEVGVAETYPCSNLPLHSV
jgi:hypothetical protein